MTWPYQYSPYVWPVLTSITLSVALAVYGFRHRSAPGTVPFGVMLALAIPWVVANGLLVTGRDEATRLFWFKFQALFILPLASTELCFGLEYSGLGRWLNGRTFAALAIPPAVFILLVLTNDMHHLVWREIWFEGTTARFVRGPAHWAAIGYGLFLSLLYLLVLAWLFAHSPGHRWIAAGMIVALFCMRSASILNVAGLNPFAPLNLMVYVLSFSLLLYGFAIIRFRMFEAVPVARNTAMECMADGLMVLDAENRVADINEAARNLLGVTRSKVMGKEVTTVLANHPHLGALLASADAARSELPLDGVASGSYLVSASPIFDRRGFRLGRLVTFHDVTEERRIQAKLLEQERALAMLRERELLARELHDGIGQMVAAMHLQVRCASEFLARGDAASVESSLRGLAEATQGVKESVREYLSGVKALASANEGLLPALRRFLEGHARTYGLRTDLVVPPEIEAERFDPDVEAQLQPIIQEALINAGKHSGAASARVVFERGEGEVGVSVEDDGRGFEPDTREGGRGFGLRAMRGRAEALGGRLELTSTPGGGTRVSVRVPTKKEKA